eukprot:UN04019
MAPPTPANGMNVNSNNNNNNANNNNGNNNNNTQINTNPVIDRPIASNRYLSWNPKRVDPNQPTEYIDDSDNDN